MLPMSDAGIGYWPLLGSMVAIINTTPRLSDIVKTCYIQIWITQQLHYHLLLRCTYGKRHNLHRYIKRSFNSRYLVIVYLSVRLVYIFSVCINCYVETKFHYSVAAS